MVLTYLAVILTFAAGLIQLQGDIDKLICTILYQLYSGNQAHAPLPPICVS